MSEHRDESFRVAEHKSPSRTAVPYHDSSTMWNGVSASVVEIHQGLTRTTLKLTGGKATSLKVRWPSEKAEGTCPNIGEQVMVCIPAEQVLLATPDRWPGHERWNRLRGHVVGIEGTDPLLHIVKVRGDWWTLRTMNLIVGASGPPQVSDAVNIVIDPERIHLMRDGISRQWSARRFTVESRSEPIGMVRLKGRTHSVHRTSNGCLLTVSIGEARVSALLLAESEEHNPVWKPGMDIEICMNEKDSWLSFNQGALLPCNLAYLSPEWDQQF